MSESSFLIVTRSSSTFVNLSPVSLDSSVNLSLFLIAFPGLNRQFSSILMFHHCIHDSTNANTLWYVELKLHILHFLNLHTLPETIFFTYFAFNCIIFLQNKNVAYAAFFIFLTFLLLCLFGDRGRVLPTR